MTTSVVVFEYFMPLNYPHLAILTLLMKKKFNLMTAFLLFSTQIDKVYRMHTFPISLQIL